MTMIIYARRRHQAVLMADRLTTLPGGREGPPALKIMSAGNRAFGIAGILTILTQPEIDLLDELETLLEDDPPTDDVVREFNELVSSIDLDPWSAKGNPITVFIAGYHPDVGLGLRHLEWLPAGRRMKLFKDNWHGGDTVRQIGSTEDDVSVNARLVMEWRAYGSATSFLRAMVGEPGRALVAIANATSPVPIGPLEDAILMRRGQALFVIDKDEAERDEERD